MIGTLVVAFGVAAATALVVCAAAWGVSRGRIHRSDRVGAAALAVGFVAAYQGVTGGGWHPERPVTAMPLVAVIGALILPRIAARAAPDATVHVTARGFVLVAAAASAVTMLAAGRPEAAALALAVLGGMLGAAAGERLAGRDADVAGPADADAGLAAARPPGSGSSGRPLATGPDRRPGTWVLAALMVGLVPVLAA